MIGYSDPESIIMTMIRDTLLARMNPTTVRVSPGVYRWLVEESCDLRLTVTGQDLPIFQAYRRDHPEAVPWYPVSDRAERAPAVTGRALRHMRCLKKSFGVSHYDGVPIEIADDATIEVVREPWGRAT